MVREPFSPTRMIQLRGGLGFGVEALAFEVAGERPAQNHFQRDNAVPSGLPRALHHAHRAAPGILDQIVLAKRRRRGRRATAEADGD